MAGQLDGLTGLGAVTPVRIDQQGRVLCTAHARTTGALCCAPAMIGQRTCRRHGGATVESRQAARLRMGELVPDAIEALARLLTSADESVRLKAANSILDRTGHVRTTRVESGDAHAMLLARIVELKANRAIEGGLDA